MTRRPLLRVLLAAGLLLAGTGAHATRLDVAWRVPGTLLDAGSGNPSTARQAIAPGATLAFSIPPSTPLRWRVTDGDRADLEIGVAGDGDLFRASTGEATRGGWRWLPPVPHGRRVLFGNRGGATIVVEAWRGEIIEPEAPALRTRLDAANGQPARWRAMPSRDVGHGYFAPAGKPLQFTVQGPSRVELESRLLLDATEARPSWSLATAVDDDTPRTWRLLAPVDRDGTLAIGGAQRLASLPRSLHLDIPAGEHRVAVSAGPGVLVRAFGGRDLLFADNISPAWPRRDDALARSLRFQDARERVIGGDPAAATAEWRALDPAAALLQSRSRATFDVEPLGDGPLAFGWALDDESGSAARMVMIGPGQELSWQVPPGMSRVELEARGEDGTRITLREGDVATELVLHRGVRDEQPHGRTVLDAGGGHVSVRADRRAMVRLRGALPRDPGVAPAPGVRAAVDLPRFLAEPLRSPAWFAPLAERLAARIERVSSRAASPCRDRDDGLPGDWPARVDDLVAGQRPDEAARLLARARLLCSGGDIAGDRLAALLRANGEFRAWEQLRLDDSARRQDDGAARAIAELRTWYRTQQAWTDLEALGARRAVAGDHRAWGLVGEALAQQGDGTLLRSWCSAMAAAAVQPDTPLLARSCAEAALQHESAPWVPVVAIEGSAGGLRTLESVATGNRSSRFLARDDAPFTLRIEGPLTLRVEARRLLDDGATTGPAGWIRLALDGRPWQLPLDAGAASIDWRVAGSTRLPGPARRFLLRIPPGVHEVALHGDGELLFAASVADAGWSSLLGLPAFGGPQPVDEPALDDDDIRNAPAADDNTDRHLLRLAWWAEHSAGAPQRGYRARLHALAAREPATPWRQRLLARVDRDHAWQRESRVIDSAGLRYIDDAGGGSPATRLRRALLDLPANDGYATTGAWLGHEAAPGLLVDGGAWRRVRVSARQAALPGADAMPAALTILVNDRAAAQLDTAPGGESTAEIAPGAGLHRVVVRLDEPAPDLNVQVRMEGFDGTRWQALSLQGDRTFLVSTADTPVRVAVDAAEWLRIDELSDGRVRTRFHFQPEAGVATLAPTDGRESTMRVLSLRADPHPMPQSLPPPAVPRPSLARARAAATLAALDAPVTWTLAAGEGDPAGRASDDQAYVRADWNSDEEGGGARSGDRVAIGWLHRERLPSRGWWWRSDAYVRALQGPDETLGTRQLLEWHPEKRAWHAQLEGQAHALLARDGGDAQSTLLAARWRHEQDIDRALSHRVGVEGYARWLGADAVRGATIADADVWSPWKEDHLYGWRLDDRWRWQPVEDAAAQLHWGADGNEAASDPLDSLWLEPSARLWWRGVAVEASVRWQRFLADADRDNAYERRTLGVDAQWRQWHARGGWFLQAGWRRDLDAGSDTVTIGGGWSWGAGPQAWLPSELMFRTLEQRAWDRANPRDRLDTDTEHAAR